MEVVIKSVCVCADCHVTRSISELITCLAALLERIPGERCLIAQAHVANLLFVCEDVCPISIVPPTLLRCLVWSRVSIPVVGMMSFN